MELLPQLQAMLIQSIFIAYYSLDKGTEKLASVPSKLFGLLLKIGAFDQRNLKVFPGTSWQMAELYRRRVALPCSFVWAMLTMES